jgi:predicted NAD-dependent protein-ADP-ribosyltransferase YbiA (DUF1768 family)
MLRILFILCFLISCSDASSKYPSHWWEDINESERQGSWEILPNEAKVGELILSKRNELKVFSNLAHTPFVLAGIEYASIEALWQMMKYPDVSDTNDIRNEIIGYEYLRKEVINLYGFDAKKAGDKANAINRANGVSFVSYNKKKFNYKDLGSGSELHYKIIVEAITLKINQNPKLRKLLDKTKGLILKPDHKQGRDVPRSYLYHEILMKVRDN